MRGSLHTLPVSSGSRGCPIPACAGRCLRGIGCAPVRAVGVPPWNVSASRPAGTAGAGFERMAAEARLGAVASREVSRIARDRRRAIGMGRAADTLLIDFEAVAARGRATNGCSPVPEAAAGGHEPSLLRRRTLSARHGTARRGELPVAPPVGDLRPVRPPRARMRLESRGR